MDNLAISVQDVSKTFKLPHDKHTSLKSFIINTLRKGRKGYELQEALKGVSFQVSKGDFFGIVGRNGSGKSTLLKMLAGIYTPSEGEIQVYGNLTPFIELGVGFNSELTGRENVFLNGALLGFNRKEMHVMYKDIVDFAELQKFMDQKLKNYSSGMQVRLAFSIAIRAQTDILLIDEVLAVGDAAFQQKCFNYFEELKLQHKTVILVSHDMNAIRRFCNKAVYIKDGKLIHAGTPAEVADIYTLDNISRDRSKGKGPVTSSYKVDSKISNQTEGSLNVGVVYKSKGNEEVYVGISVLKDGFSIAEIITAPNMKLRRSGKLSYLLDTTVLNGGAYQIAAALFRQKNRELVAIGKNQQFSVKGHDVTKGAALKLADTWESK